MHVGCSPIGLLDQLDKMVGSTFRSPWPKSYEHNRLILRSLRRRVEQEHPHHNARDYDNTATSDDLADARRTVSMVWGSENIDHDTAVLAHAQ